jgi:hypothetical protein
MHRFNVHDTEGNALAGVKIIAIAERHGQVLSKHTNNDGYAEIDFTPWSILADARVEMPEGYECVYCHAPELDIAVLCKFILKRGMAHCYNAAGELVMEHGEEKCVSGDKYVCSNGTLSVSERDPDCNGTGNGKACPIACVCMGTPLIDALGPIREFRDFTLKRAKLGRCFVSFYYSQVGPFLSLALVRSETLRKGGRWVVRRILRRLEK